MNVSGGSGRGNRRKPMAEINVVPYIDVSLVLLIIFMITTPLLQTGVDVDLPQAEAKMVDPKEEPPIIISINAEGRLYVESGSHQDEEVDDVTLTTKVTEAVISKPGRSVLIRGDKSVQYGRVVTVMAALKQAGIPSVGLMTRPSEQ